MPSSRAARVGSCPSTVARRIACSRNCNEAAVLQSKIANPKSKI
jgi:hypothetical protein